jgi:hypothetical protein
MPLLRKYVFQILLIIFIFFVVKSAQAQTTTCADFSITPNPVLQNQDASLVYSKGLRANELLRATIQGTNKNITVDCQENSQMCGASFTNIGSFDTSDLNIGSSYNVQIIYIPASGITNQLNCSTSFSYTNNTQTFCSNRGLHTVNPTSGFENTPFIFSGCIGDGGNPNNPCSGTYSRIAIKNGNITVAESSINNSGNNSCDASGNFSIAISGLPIGRLTAQLTQNQNIVGDLFTFDVESGSNITIGEACQIDQQCTVGNQSGTRSCSGTYQNQNSSIICVSNTCSSCSYCGDNICSSNEISNCAQDCSQVEPTPTLGLSFQVIPCPTVNIDEWNNRNDQNDLPPMDGIQTALGCLPSSPQGLLAVLFRIAIGIGGGIAFLLILYGGIRMMIARGDPKGIQEAKEILTSAIVGLLLIILSMFILRVLGVDILSIPGFS